MHRSVYLLCLFVSALTPIFLALALAKGVFDPTKDYFESPILIILMIFFAALGLAFFTILFRIFVYQLPLSAGAPTSFVRGLILPALLVIGVLSFWIGSYFGVLVSLFAAFLVLRRTV